MLRKKLFSEEVADWDSMLLVYELIGMSNLEREEITEFLKWYQTLPTKVQDSIEEELIDNFN